ncbi:DUF4142 domain-containing protein [Cellulomonas edaphi]|uniref:DUF4142 domain-containing protein n=1 Tax=Cellulomonas edaphi TaxID=3053468 RepID=A0ABT7S7M1_9CELL|nr:DUF4142 domain-containing protein [Cellulomons edaphi]MDM7831602.1 DUF4142 domain-containing protein [Cellulomons edaphi]
MRRLLRPLMLATTAVVGLLAVTAAAPAQPSAEDSAWLVEAHQRNLAEIASGAAAVELASAPAVRELGRMVEADHRTLDTDLQSVATELAVVLPSEPREDQRTSLAALRAIRTEEFDRAWVASQITAHRAALEAASARAASGGDPAVVALADAAAPVVQHHLRALEAAADAPDFQEGGETPDNGASTWPTAAVIAVVIVVVGVVAYVVARRTGRLRPRGRDGRA